MVSLDTNNFLPNHHGCTAFCPSWISLSIYYIKMSCSLTQTLVYSFCSPHHFLQSLSDLVIHFNSVCPSTCQPFCPSCVLPQALLPHFCCLWNIFPVFTPWKDTNWIYFLGKLPQSLRHLIYCIIHYIFYISSPTRQHLETKKLNHICIGSICSLFSFFIFNWILFFISISRFVEFITHFRCWYYWRLSVKWMLLKLISLYYFHLFMISVIFFKILHSSWLWTYTPIPKILFFQETFLDCRISNWNSLISVTLKKIAFVRIPLLLSVCLFLLSVSLSSCLSAPALPLCVLVLLSMSCLFVIPVPRPPATHISSQCWESTQPYTQASVQPLVYASS